MENDRPKTGLGVMIFKDGKVLLSLKTSSHGAGQYAFPGGHLEYMESFEECAKREVKEESGIEIKNVRFQFLGNLKAYAPKHYVQIGLLADWAEGEPKVMEPGKSGEWGWYDLDNPPMPLFEGSRMLIESYKTGRNYFDA